MNGSIKTPIKAVKTSNTATLLSLKNRSTRYLSRCTEMGQSTGPENAKTSQDILLQRPCFPGATQHGAKRSDELQTRVRYALRIETIPDQRRTPSGKRGTLL